LGAKLSKGYNKLIRNDETFNKFKTVTAYKNSPNLKQILVHSKLEMNKTGYFRSCGQNNCKACKNQSIDTNKFISTNRKNSFDITDNLTCSSSNLIYLITCNKCQKQYVGETGRTIRERLTDHRSAIKLKKKTPIGIHFNLPNHSQSNLNIIGIESIKTNTKAEQVRKSREFLWQKKLDTFFPRGLNGMPTED
jgi:hypothetical protein